MRVHFSMYGVFKDALPPHLLTDSLAKYVEDGHNGWSYCLFFFSSKGYVLSFEALL